MASVKNTIVKIFMVAGLMVSAPVFTADKDCPANGLQIPNHLGVPIAVISSDSFQELNVTTVNDILRDNKKLPTATSQRTSGSSVKDKFWFFLAGRCYEVVAGPAIDLGSVDQFKSRVVINQADLKIPHGASLVVQNVQTGQRKGMPATGKHRIRRSEVDQIIYFKPAGWSTRYGWEQIFSDDVKSSNTSARCLSASLDVEFNVGNPHKFVINVVDWSAVFMVRVGADGKFKKTNFTRKVQIDGDEYPSLLNSYHFTLLPPGKLSVLGEGNEHDQTHENFCDVTESGMRKILGGYNPFAEKPDKRIHWLKGSDFNQCDEFDDFNSPRVFRFSVGFRF